LIGNITGEVVFTILFCIGFSKNASVVASYFENICVATCKQSLLNCRLVGVIEILKQLILVTTVLLVSPSLYNVVKLSPLPIHTFLFHHIR